MHAFKFYRRYWAAIGGLIFVALAFFVGLSGHQVPALQRFMVLMYMALLFHQFEEYIFPGGFPAAANIGLFGEKDTPYGFAQYQADEFEVRHGIASLFRKN